MTQPTAPTPPVTPTAPDPTMARIAELESQRTALLATTTDPNATLIQKQQAQAAIAKLEPALSSAYRDAASNERAAAKVSQSGGTGTQAQLILAAAATARADALETRANAYAEGTGAKRQQLEADSKLKDAEAAKSQALADLANATLPDDIKKAHVALDQANATLESTKQANIAAGLNNDILGARAAVAPRVEAATATTAEAGASTAQSTAAIAAAQAGTAANTAAAALQKAQADADSATLALKTAQAQFDATTPEMRSGALQASLDQAKAQAGQAQEALRLAQDTHDNIVKQGQATLAGTQAQTAQTVLGPLAGAQAKIAELAAMIRSGQIDDPAQAAAHLQQYLQSALQGTTPQVQAQSALDAETSRMSSANSLAASQGSTYGSGFGTALSQFSKLNDTTPAGSDSAGRGFLASLNLLQSGIRGFAPTAPMNSPLLQQMANYGQTPSVGQTALGAAQAANPPPTTGVAAPAAPTTQIAPDGTVTIQHTASTPNAAALLAPGMAGTSADPMVAGSPALLNANDPALPHHVEALWANDPNLQAASGSALGDAFGAAVGAGGQ